jgi:asparagine synthase (glutamine-hydrolysing)
LCTIRGPSRTADASVGPRDMCGIFGAVFPSADAVIDVDAALTALGHRGPDSAGVFRNADVTFGHTRLAILDRSPAGAQPMVSADGTCVVVFNGEIYNHHELRTELASRGVTFRSRSDTEVIVEGYRVLGAAFLERLDGMFAIGLYDALASRLILIRDRVGKKPVYYKFEHGGLRFASECRALFASGARANVDVRSLPLLFGLGYVPPPSTLYEGMEQLPPASVLTIDRGGEPRLHRYWSPPFSAPPLRVPVADATREVRRLVERAVHRRLEADVPLGAFLSGGIDSSIVVGIASRAATRRLRTFSIGFAGDAAYDETSFARVAARAFGTEHTEFTLEANSIPELIDRLVAVRGGPFGDASAIPTSVVSMLARRRVTVALGGDGGDELFCGYSRFLAAEYGERIPRALRRGAASVVARLPGQGSWRSPIRRASRMARTLTRSLPQRMLAWTSYFVDDLADLLRPDIASQVATNRARAWADSLGAECLGGSPLSRALDFNFRTYLPDDLLAKADSASMLHSLELRSPLLDTALIDYVARLPDGFKRRGLTTKWVLRKAFADMLPPTIVSRRKMGFGMPLGTWFRGPLREYIQDSFGPAARLYEYVRPEYVTHLLAEHQSNRRDLGHEIWLLLTFERWLHALPDWSSPAVRSVHD